MSNPTQLHIEEDMNGGLPEGWTTAKLGDLCTHPQYGWTTSANKNGTGLKLLRTTDISGGTVNWSTVPACTRGPDDPQKYLLAPGDILVSRAGSVGLSYLVKECPEAIFASYLIRFRPKPPLESEFIDLFLKSPQYWAAIAEEAAGIAIPNVNASKLKEIVVPLPPLSEQRRIVARLEDLFAGINVTKECLAKVSAILKRFRQAVLTAACSGGLTADWRKKNLDVEPASEFLTRIQQDKKKPKKAYLSSIGRDEDIYFDIPDSWSFCFFEDICSNKPHAIKAGPFGSSLTKSCYTPSGYKIYGQEQVIRGDANYGDYYIDEKKFLELKSCEVEARDLLISLVGTIGKVLIIPDKFQKGIINPRLVKVSLHSEISSEYIAKYLVSPLAINMFQKDSHGGTMEILNLRMLKKLPIPLPPMIEQHEIVRGVEAMFKLADAVEKRVAAATMRAEKLTQAVLAKAFRGELVPTEAELARLEGRSYETASELLSRIRSERTASQTSQKARRNRICQ
jgi:type I restriction enzyme S subunit